VPSTYATSDPPPGITAGIPQEYTRNTTEFLPGCCVAGSVFTMVRKQRKRISYGQFCSPASSRPRAMLTEAQFCRCRMLLEATGWESMALLLIQIMPFCKSWPACSASLPMR
jgi:hypothetical protein